MLKKDLITYLVVHCADTPDAEDLRASDIHKLHLGFGWDGAGYHHIICRNGQVEAGRPAYWQGAHVYGQNENSLGICLIGRQHFTPAQMNSLSRLLHQLKCRYPAAEIVGHRDIQDTHKTCPNFDVRSWWQDTTLFGGRTAYVTAACTGLYKLPPGPMQTGSVLDTELLLGESVALSGQTTTAKATGDGFVCVSACADGYQGWVRLADLGRPQQGFSANATVIRPLAVITATPDLRSTCIRQLSFGARLMVADPPDQGMVPVISLDAGGMLLAGYLAEHHIRHDHQPRDDDWTGWAEAFTGCPYKWGGRSAAGLDCSALIQLSLAASGYALPRDTGPQLRALTGCAQPYNAPYDAPANNFNRGDLIFWTGHVGICVDDMALIHANGWHHCVAVEGRADAVMRLAEHSGPPVAHVPASAIRQSLPRAGAP